MQNDFTNIVSRTQALNPASAAGIPLNVYFDQSIAGGLPDSIYKYKMALVESRPTSSKDLFTMNKCEVTDRLVLRANHVHKNFFPEDRNYNIRVLKGHVFMYETGDMRVDAGGEFYMRGGNYTLKTGAEPVELLAGHYPIDD